MQRPLTGGTPSGKAPPGTSSPACSGGPPASVRWAWDPNQLPSAQDWLSAAIGVPSPGASGGKAPTVHDKNPWTPQKPLVETPPKLEAPKGVENDDTTPPKDINVNLPPRRGNSRLVTTGHTKGPLRSNPAARKDPLTANKNVTNTCDATMPAHQARRGYHHSWLDVDCEAEDARRRFPSEPPLALESRVPSRRQQREPTTATSVEPAVRSEPPVRPQSAPEPAPMHVANHNAAAREPLQDFAVTSPRFSRDSALCPLEELPASLRHAFMFVRNVPALPCTNPAICRLLPPARPDMTTRPTLVLDLDETLVHCSRSSGSRSGPPPANPDLIVMFDDQPAPGLVLFRPFVHQFLEAASKAFEVVVFTASQQSYADKVCNALDPSGTLIEHRLYRQHCTEHRGAFFKELGLMNRPLRQCILVDNSPISVACNADNSVLISSWYDDPNDQELYDLLCIFQDMQLHGGGDCGRYLANRYGLRNFFEGLRDSVGHPRH